MKSSWGKYKDAEDAKEAEEAEGKSPGDENFPQKTNYLHLTKRLVHPSSFLERLSASRYGELRSFPFHRMFFGKKKNPHDTACFVSHVVVTVLLFLATVASLVNVLMSHYSMSQSMFVFGTNADALSLIAFAVTISLWMKSMKSCMTGCEACGTMNGKR